MLLAPYAQAGMAALEHGLGMGSFTLETSLGGTDRFESCGPPLRSTQPFLSSEEIVMCVAAEGENPPPGDLLFR